MAVATTIAWRKRLTTTLLSAPLSAPLAALLAALLAACTPLPTRSLQASKSEIVEWSQHPAPLPSTTGFSAVYATPEQRAATTELIWRTIADVYYDPTFSGIDLPALRARTLADASAVRDDAEFYRVLKRDVGALHDSHTTIVTPREAEDFRTKRATQIGFAFAIAEGRVVVASIVDGFPADRAGMRPGMIVEAIDGQVIDDAWFVRATSTTQAPTDAASTGFEPLAEPVATSLDPVDIERSRRQRAVRRLLVSPDGVPHPHRLTMRRNDDTLAEVDVEAREGDVPTREQYELRSSGIGVLRLSRFDSAVRVRMARDIEAARLQTRGLIVDLRGNPGGEQRLFQWLVGRFVSHRVELAETIERSGERRVTGSVDAYPPSDPADPPYLKPIAVLIDRATASAAELTAHALVEQRDAIAVGEATCGCVVAIRRDYVLPDGGALRVAERGFRSARGRRMEGDPLVPSIAVVPTLAERRATDDVVLKAAEQALLKR